MVVGVDFADNLHLQVGDHLSDLFRSREIKKMKEACERKEESWPLCRTITKCAAFSTPAIMNTTPASSSCSLANAQDLYDLDDSVHGLFVKLDDPYQAPVVKRQLEQALNYKIDEGTFYAQSWMDQNSGMLSALVVEKNVMFYLLFFIVLVAALCILSAQITFVIQKTREIGMLKALGATKLQISGIFLFQSAIIGVIGVAAGYGLGMLAVAYRNEFLHFMRSATGWELFPASVYGFGELPALIHAKRRGDHLPQFVCDLHFRRTVAGGSRGQIATSGGAAL